MKIRAVIIDFDGTITTCDTTDILCELAGKKQKSEELNKLFHEGKIKGLDGLVQRINFMNGLSLEQIQAAAKDDYIRVGAHKLFRFFRKHRIVSIIASGSIMPMLEVYKEKLGADYLVGSKPTIKNGRIDNITKKDYSVLDFKAKDSKAILDSLGIPYSSVVAIGDSPADKTIFDLAAVSIAINPKSGIEKSADYTIQDDLYKAIQILENIMHK